LKLKSLKKDLDDERSYLFELAADEFKRGWECDPANKETLRNLADCLTYLGHNFWANYYYSLAVTTNPHDHHCLYKFATFLDKQNFNMEAEDYYLQALEKNTNFSVCLAVYADFLWTKLGENSHAEEFYLRAIQNDPTNTTALNNYACFLTLCEHDNAKAKIFFEKALENKEHQEAKIHYNNFRIFSRQPTK